MFVFSQQYSPRGRQAAYCRGGCWQSPAYDPAPERKGEIAARESLEPEGGLYRAAQAPLGIVDRRAERLDGGERPAPETQQRHYGRVSHFLTPYMVRETVRRLI